MFSSETRSTVRAEYHRGDPDEAGSGSHSCAPGHKTVCVAAFDGVDPSLIRAILGWHWFCPWLLEWMRDWSVRSRPCAFHVRCRSPASAYVHSAFFWFQSLGQGHADSQRPRQCVVFLLLVFLKAQRSSSGFAIARTAVLAMIPCSWAVFVMLPAFPREGHVVWVVGDGAGAVLRRARRRPRVSLA